MWKYLGVAALAAVLAEVALTRWIAQQRRTGAARPVRFASVADPAALRRRADELRGVAVGEPGEEPASSVAEL